MQNKNLLVSSFLQKFFILFEILFYFILKIFGFYDFNLKNFIKLSFIKAAVFWFFLIIGIIIFFVETKKINVISQTVLNTNNKLLINSYFNGFNNQQISLIGIVKFINNQNNFLIILNQINPKIINDLAFSFLSAVISLKFALSFLIIALLIWLIFNYNIFGTLLSRSDTNKITKFLFFLDALINPLGGIFSWKYLKKTNINFYIRKSEIVNFNILEKIWTWFKKIIIKLKDFNLKNPKEIISFHFPQSNYDPKKFIEIKNLSFSYDLKNISKFKKVFKKNKNYKMILENINCKIKEKKFTSILGANGSGKSTLIKTIMHQNKNFFGKIMWAQKDLKYITLKQFSQNVSNVSQAHTIVPGIRVYDYVSYGRKPHLKLLSSLSDNDHKIIKKALKKTNIEHLSNLLTTNLSGGQQQKVLIAMAIAQDTKTVILDEPTTYLDIKNQYELLDLLKDMQLKENKTIIAILHDINQAIQYSDEIILIKNGMIYAQGKPIEVINQKSLLDVFNLKSELIYKNNKVYIADAQSVIIN